MGQGLLGQCAVDGRRMLITSLPADVVPIRSGLFKATPNNVVVLPVLYEGQVKAVIELGSVGSFTDLQISFLEQLTAGIGIVLNSIEATMQTEGLLQQSQQLATELQTRQRELQQTNEQLEQKAQRACRTERRGGAQEPGDRAGARRAGGTGGGTGADVEVQVGIPRQHVARAAHAAELDPDPGPAAWRQSGRQPDAAPGRVRAHDPRCRHRSAQPDQRHSRSVEDRIGHDVGGCRGDPAAQPAGDRDAAVPPRGGKPRPVVQRAGAIRRCAASPPTASVCSRC